MNQDIAALQIRLEATTARFERQLKRADDAMRKRTQSMSRKAQTLDRMLESVGEKFGVKLALRAGAAAVAIGAVAKAVSDVVRNGDKFKLLEARFTAVTGSAERGAQAFQNVLSIVEETGVNIDDAASSVSRFTIAAESIGATDEEVKQLTANVIKLGQVGGASGQELSSGATQLAQALASGRLQGDELRSILENMPLVAKAIAEGLNISVGELRAMGSEGELTSRKVFDAILSKTDDIQDAFEQLPPTLDVAVGKLAGSWAKFTAEVDKSLGISQSLVSVLLAANSALEEFEEKRRQNAEAQNLIEEFNQPPPPPVTLTPAGSGGVSTANIERLGTAADFAEVDRKVAEALAKQAAMMADDALGGLNNSPLPPRRPGSSGNRIDLRTPPPPRTRRARGGRSAVTRVDTDSAVRMVQSIQERVQALSEERGALGLAGQELERYRARLEASRIESDLVKLAARENTVVTDEQRQQISALADEYLILAENVARERAEMEAHAEAVELAAQKQEDLANSLEGVASKFIGAIQQADSFTDALKNIGFELAELAMQAALGKGPLGGVFNDLIGVSSGGITGLFSGASSGGAVAASGGSSFLPPGFARGGVAKGMAIVGENGPELINVGSPSRVFSNASSNHIIGNSAPVVVNINNTSGAEITAQQSGPNLEILVEQAVSRSISQGGRVNKAIRQSFQLGQPATRRG